MQQINVASVQIFPSTVPGKSELMSVPGTSIKAGSTIEMQIQTKNKIGVALEGYDDVILVTFTSQNTGEHLC